MEAGFSHASRYRRWLWVLWSAMLCLRFAHVHLLWADEDYHLAAAIQMLNGKVPYRDFWYDKPPLSAAYYLLIGGYAGWPLRALDAAYVALGCWLAYRLARVWWGEAEGWVSALLLAFFTTFYLPSATIPFAADALMLVPHLAAVYCARQKSAVWAGVWTGVAFLANPKALFVLATCAVWLGPGLLGPGLLKPGLLPLLAGFAMPTGCAALAAIGLGAWHGYIEQVWRWGLVYAARPPVEHPLANGSVRTLNWLGFHSALVAGAVFGWLNVERSDRLRLGAWLLLSFAGVCLGSRFAPHYFLQVLPPLVIIASRGIVVAWRSRRVPTAMVFSLLLLVPLVRFGPRYAALAYANLTDREPRWADVALDLDSRHAAGRLLAMAHPGDTLFVWGYRPDLYVFTRMTPDGRFWDSQASHGSSGRPPSFRERCYLRRTSRSREPARTDPVPSDLDCGRSRAAESETGAYPVSGASALACRLQTGWAHQSVAHLSKAVSETCVCAAASCHPMTRATIAVLMATLLSGCRSRWVRAPSPSSATADLRTPYIDLQPGWRLRVITPLTRSGKYQLGLAGQQVTGSAVTLAAGDDFIGYQTSYYAVQPRRRAGIHIVFTSAQDTRDGITAARSTPHASLFQLPRGARYVRLLYLARASRSDHDMAVLASSEEPALMHLTATVQAHPEACENTRRTFCSWIPAGIAVRPEVRTASEPEQWNPAR